MLESIKEQNFILMCDSYKVQHKQEYPKDTEYLYSVIVPRKGSKYTDEIVAVGQTYLSAYLESVRITKEMIDEAETEIHQYGYDFNREDWEYILNEYGGVLPLAMYGVEEGRVVKPQTPIVGFINTDKKCAWLVSYVETISQSLMWKMCEVASKSRFLQKVIKAAMLKTGADMNMLEYKLHNFGDRGASSTDEAVRSAIAHATIFSGSDCTSANRYIKKLYGTDRAYLSSVEATEHSVMCSWSDAKTKNDFAAAEMAVSRLEAVVERTKRGIGIPLMSVVIDTYDSHRFAGKFIGEDLKDRVLNSGGKLVLRPDSGDPLIEPIQIISILKEKFGGEVNNKGYFVLNPAVGVIQGDGIDEISLPKIIENVIVAGYSMDNIVFGMGGGLTHRGGRDDYSFSMKAAARYDGTKWIDLLKEPKTDTGKKSLTGLVRCFEKSDGSLAVMKALSGKELEIRGPGWRLWFSNGYKQFSQNFDSVRKYARADL